MAKCMDPADPKASAGVAAMALHGAGSQRLLALADSPAPSVADVVPALAGLDTSDLVVGFAKAVGPDAAQQMLSWHWDAAQGARQVVSALVSKQMAPSVAIQRAAAAYGISASAAGPYVAKVAGPLPPAAVADAGLREVEAWAAAVSQRCDADPIAKEWINFDTGRREYVERDFKGRFAREKDEPAADTAQTQAQEKQVKREARLKRLQLLQRAQASQKAARAYRDSKRAAQQQATRRTEVQRDEALDAFADTQRQEEAAPQKKQRAASKAKLSAREVLATRQQRKQVMQQRAQALKNNLIPSFVSQDLGGSSNYNFDPPLANDHDVKAEIGMGFDEIATSNYSALQVVQVPLSVVTLARAATIGSESLIGPRISVQAANNYLNEDDGREYGLQVTEVSHSHLPARVGMDDSGQLCVNVVLSGGAVVNAWDELAAFQSLDAPAAFEEVARLVSLLSHAEPDSYTNAVKTWGMGSDLFWHSLIGSDPSQIPSIAETFLEEKKQNLENKMTEFYEGIGHEMTARDQAGSLVANLEERLSNPHRTERDVENFLEEYDLMGEEAEDVREFLQFVDIASPFTQRKEDVTPVIAHNIFAPLAEIQSWVNPLQKQDFRGLKMIDDRTLLRYNEPPF